MVIYLEIHRTGSQEFLTGSRIFYQIDIRPKTDFSHDSSSGLIKLEYFVGESLIEYFIRIFLKSRRSELRFGPVSTNQRIVFERLCGELGLDLILNDDFLTISRRQIT